jgi:hypothetical protein
MKSESLEELSDDACVIGFSHFPSVKSTLSFGGDHAKMEITPRARAALDELILKGFVVACEPLDSYQNREHYRGAATVQHIIKDRTHLHPFGPDAVKNTGWTTFRAKDQN